MIFPLLIKAMLKFMSVVNVLRNWEIEEPFGDTKTYTLIDTNVPVVIIDLKPVSIYRNTIAKESSKSEKPKLSK